MSKTSEEVGDVEDHTRISELEEKKLVRKIDWILMPILTITLGLQVSCEGHWHGGSAFAWC